MMTLKHSNYLALVLMSMIAFGCATHEIPQDFSSPEGAFVTAFLAVKEKKYEIVLKGMSEGYKKNFGNSYEEQLKTLETQGRKIHYSRGWERVVKSVEYSLDRKQATIFYDEYDGQKVVSRNARMPMVKDGADWKIGT